MALVSVALPEASYSIWDVRKFITEDQATILFLLFLCLALGVFFTSGVSPRARTMEIHLDSAKLRMLRTAYRVLLWLTIIGYVAWSGSAIAQGIGIENLLAVLDRSQGAIGELKANARPIGGVTTLTQFAPFAVALNLLLWRVGVRHLPGLFFMYTAALFRVFFYAERLALIELIIPTVLVGAMILSSRPKWRRRVALLPVFGVPVVWGIFAISEYFRSWVYYSVTATQSFGEWVTLRLIGYYVTSFNNSALLSQTYESHSALPWFSIQWFWNFPGVESIVQHPGIGGLPAESWWTYTLLGNANFNFTNTGSFLTTYAEFGLFGSMLFWLVTGLAIGAIFRSMSNGNVPALLLYATMFVGLLELSRIMYWTLGRSTPIVIAAVVIAYQWAKLTPRAPTYRSGNRRPIRPVFGPPEKTKLLPGLNLDSVEGGSVASKPSS